MTIALDIATAPLPNAADYLDTVSAPSNYRDEAKIAAYKAEKQAERLSTAALDLDLCRITGLAFDMEERDHLTTLSFLCRTEDEERMALTAVTPHIRMGRLITYNGRAFDVPVLLRRARYLGVDFPAISTDRYKSPIIDLMQLLSDGDPSRRRSLAFYVKRLGWTDLVKPLSGADEARVPETGQWAELEQSLAHDVTAIQRLAQWLGVW